MLRTLVLSALAVTALAGCSVNAFTYTLTEYGEVKGVRVRLGCNDAYEVFDRPGAARLLVVTNGINEIAMGTCPGLAGLPRDERMRRVAKIYLEETTSRPDCRVASDAALSEMHTEFAYRCGPAQPATRRP